MRGEDRLSDLPEPLLHHIFSFLPTKEVVRSTSLLSKKWRYFWASFPYLFFNIDCDDACAYVDKFMCRRGGNGPGLQGIRLRLMYYDQGDLKRVKKWIAIALNRNVRELDIFKGYGSSAFTVPAKVFAAVSSVKAIKLESVIYGYHFMVPRPMLSSPNLKTLELIKIKLPKGNSKREIILGCPVLDTLIMNKCCYSHLQVVNLSLNRLKKLEIDNTAEGLFPVGVKGAFYRLGDCKLELHTPNLSTFVYRGVMYKDCSFGNFEALINVDLFLCPPFLEGRSAEFAVSREAEHVKFLQGLKGARDLSLKGIEIHSEVPDILEELLNSYTNLKKLELQASSRCGPCHTWLASVLCRCTSIETLVLNAIPFCQSEEETLALPLCPLNCLKYIAVRGVEGDDNELELLRFLFKSAVNLERLAITGGGSKNSKIERGDLLKFQDKLIALSRDFPNVEVSFQIL